MAHEEDDDLYDEEFDFVDDDEVDEAEEAESGADDEEASADDSELAEDSGDERAAENGAENADEGPVDEYGRPEQPATNYVVHVYEHQKFKRTIDRPFTPEDAEAFATEFNRTSKNYDRVAVTSKNDAKPKKALD
jgi:hypothetical protein